MTSVLNLSKWAGSVESDVIDVDDVKGLKVGASGSYLTQLKKYTVAINPASVAADTTVEQTFAVAGLVAATDIVLACVKPSVTAGLDISNPRVSADGTLAITFQNSTAGAIDAPNENYVLIVGTFN